MIRSRLFVVTVVLFGTALVFADLNPAGSSVSRELLEKRQETARKVYQQNLSQFQAGQLHPAELFGWSERWLEADLALAATKEDRTKAFQSHFERVRGQERTAIAYAKSGQARQADADAATYHRLEAEIRLLNEGVPLPPDQR